MEANNRSTVYFSTDITGDLTTLIERVGFQSSYAELQTDVDSHNECSALLSAIWSKICRVRSTIPLLLLKSQESEWAAPIVSELNERLFHMRQLENQWLILRNQPIKRWRSH